MKCLYIISVGPGNRDWLTIEAVNRIKSMDVIAVPDPKCDTRSLALEIAREFIPGSAAIEYLSLPMTYNREKLERAWKESALKLSSHIIQGKKVGMIVLGDASLFGTSIYIANELKSLDSSTKIILTPGVISPVAAAARLNEPLARGDQPLTIIPDTTDTRDLIKALNGNGNIVLMKISRSINKIIDVLKTYGILSRASVVIKAGMKDEEIILDVSTLQDRKLPYMSLMIIRNSQPNKKTSNKNSKLYIVGIGPGDRGNMTFRAYEAIKDADVIVGYKTYLSLISDIIKDKDVRSGVMTQELERAREAIDIAMKGKTVALISSGDAGIYGMSAPVFEVLESTGWKPGTPPEVEVIPGVTALCAAAALVGSPISHDFCVISLSDLLTPWETIKKRLQAAASSDMICALYNPKSTKRTEFIVIAQKIFMEYRASETPVAIVNSAYRENEHITVSTLKEFCDNEIDMLSTVIIGNSNSKGLGDLIITPRGYSNKYRLKR